MTAQFAEAKNSWEKAAVCYDKEQVQALSERLKECEIAELDYESMKLAYQELKSRKTGEEYPWGTFVIGLVSGAAVAVIASEMLRGGR